MWIVLLDHSGSMGDPFEATKIETLGRVRAVDAEVKLDAAKKSFLIELRRLPASMQVILLGFTSTVTEIYSGLASDIAQFKSRLSQLEPFNGTDIAVALDYVVNYAHQKPQVLLISDGKSNLSAAKVAAHRCADDGIRVDVLLIDPTGEGLEMTEAIAGITHGRWDPVTSADELAKLTSQAGQALARDLARAEELLQQTEIEYNALETDIQEQTQVSFSAGYPSRIGRHQKYPLIVYIHLDKLKKEIEGFLKQEIVASDATPTCSNAAAATRIPPGTLITVQPNIPDIFANPPRHEVVWLEDYHKLNFEIRYAGRSAISTSCAGFIDVLADSVFVGHIPVSIAVDTDMQPSSQIMPLTATSNPCTRIFASYVREDAAVVQACKETYKKLGIYMYVDQDDLISGQPWLDALQKLIAKSDVFQLYWSQLSANSTGVAREWQLALAIGESRPGEFIRPLYWQKPMPDIPTKLGHLHFAYLDVGKLRVAPEQVQVDERDMPPWERQISDAVFPVISLMGDDSPQSIAIVQKSISHAVAFLEHMAGLRYYPPPTLLVDEYVVAAVRSYLVVDKGGGQEPRENEIEFALEILQSLALAFHVYHFEPKEIHEGSQLEHFYRLDTDLAENDFRHIRTLCEYIFSHPVTDYLKGEDPFEQPSKRDNVEDLVEQTKSTFWLRREVRHIYAVASEVDQEKIKQLVGENELAKFLDQKCDLSKSQVAEYADRIRSQSFLTISNKYRTAFFDLFDDYETTFCRSSSFCDYLDMWFEHWLGYLDAAKSQNNIVIENGYSVSRSALNWLNAQYPDVDFDIQSENKGWNNSQKPRCSWAISVSDIYQAVFMLRPIVMDAVHSTVSKARETQKYFVDTAPTYGIFASAESERTTRYLLTLAQQHNWPAGVAMTGFHKVLLCTNAFDRYKSALIDLGLDSQQADQMAAWFLTATLIHEHFHAILATGIDKRGNASWAAKNWGEWKQGNALNESLAVWLELHYFRNNQTMFDDITEYIHSGSYPEWPYSGAAKIEDIYNNHGVPGVRALIHRLREDPQFAQETFDELPWPLKNN